MSILDLLSGKTKRYLKPLFKIKLSSDEVVSEWIFDAFDIALERNKDKIREFKENLRLYKGDYLKPNTSNLNASPDNKQTGQSVHDTKLYINKLYDHTEFWVNKMTEQKPAVSVSPANTDHEDRVGAKVAKAFIDTIFYDNDFDKIDREFELNKTVAGEHFLGVLWDPQKGDLHPAYKAALEQNIEVKDVDGPVHIGDVVFKHLPAWRVLPEPCETYDKANWLMYWESENIEVIKHRYGAKAKKIRADFRFHDTEGDLLSKDYLEDLTEEGKTILITVWHKRNSLMPNGRQIVMTADGTVLENRDLPYSVLNRFPIVRDTVIDVPNEQRGMSWYQNLKGLQLQHFYLSSMIMANQKVFSFPKWVVQKNSVDVQNLTNERTVLQVRGPKDPYILQPNSTPAEVFNFLGKLEKDMGEQIRGQFATPEGLPARIDSSVALQFLFEQDQQRFNGNIAKRNRRIVEISSLALSVAGDYFDDSDERLIKILGKNQEPDIRHFKVQNFSRPYDIRIEASSALPESKAAKIGTILEFVKSMPDAFTKEQIFDLLDIGSTDKMYNSQTRALKAAESIVQDLIAGNPVPPPEGWEDLLTYWNVFSGEIQERKFKDSVPLDRRQLVLDYLGAIEMLMIEKSAINPMFAQMIQTLPLFPLIYVPAPQPTPEEIAMEQQMNQDEVIGAAELADQVVQETVAQQEQQQPMEGEE